MNNNKSITKDKQHISRYKNTNRFIRANELLPDSNEDEFSEKKLYIISNYLDPNFIYEKENIRKGIEGVYPYSLILTLNSRKEFQILYLIYEKNLTLKEISEKLNIPFTLVKSRSKQAHNNFYNNLRNYGKFHEDTKKKGGIDNE